MLERLAGARVVVTGGAGFLGSHLCERLLELGAEQVVAIDNLSTGTVANVEHLVGQPGFRFVHYDVTDYLHVPGEVTHVLHFASPASPVDYLELPIQTLKVGALGTHKALGLAHAKGATFMIASTSEVYGDPQVHPQPETYWGHVNPIGPRGVYDEAKRYGEALTYAYHRTHGVDVRVPRIFNSVLGTERLLLDDGGQLHVPTADELAAYLGVPADSASCEVALSSARVPTVDADRHTSCRQATWFVGHPTRQRCFEVTTRYGRTLRVTGDHSIFVRGAAGELIERRVLDLTTADHVAVCRRLDVPTRDHQEWDAVGALTRDRGDWRVRVTHPAIGSALAEHRRDAVSVLVREAARRGVKATRQAAHGRARRMISCASAPLGLLRELDVAVPPAAETGLWTAGRSNTVPGRVQISDELLWLLGLVVAEGHIAHDPPKTSVVVISCEDELLDRAEKILDRDLGLSGGRVAGSDRRSACLRVNSQALVTLLRDMGIDTGEKRIPGWVLGLPLRRLGWFLEGYREGDGVHSGKKLAEGRRHEFSTTSAGLRDDLIVALSRFGIVASVGSYETRFRQRTGDRTYPFFRVTVPHVAPWSPLEWHAGVKQTLQARVDGDVVWAKVREIREVEATPLVYDFCVPETERFITASGVLAHNTYGPGLRPHDGRAVPTFIGQALHGEPITIHGDGSQTRSLNYVDDEVEGLLRLLASDWTEPCNIGNPHEVSIRELAELIRELCDSDSEIVHHAPPRGRPQRPPARHHHRPARARLGTDHLAAGRAGPDHPLVPRAGRGLEAQRPLTALNRSGVRGSRASRFHPVRRAWISRVAVDRLSV